jgi:hypothetical protein
LSSQVTTIPLVKLGVWRPEIWAQANAGFMHSEMYWGLEPG